MKVLMTTDTVGGVWTCCMELCAALQPHRISVALATMGRPLSAAQRRQPDRLSNVELHESAYKLCWMNDPWSDVGKAGEWLLELERSIGPDLVHLNDLAHGGLDWQSPVLLTAHSCVLSWWEAVFGEAAPSPEWDRYRSTIAASIRAVDMLTAPTEAMLHAVLHHYDTPASIAVISNGRNFPPMVMSVEAKQHIAEPLIFSAGRLWDKGKNIAVLAAAAHDLAWPVHIAGEQALNGAEFPAARDGAAGKEQSPKFLGFLENDQLQQWLQRASIYAAPARYEPFGLSILEAARSRCALVLGDIPSLREVWGGAALYVPPDDTAQLAHVLNSLSGDPQRLSEMGSRAAQRAQRYYASHMAAAYAGAYRTLLRPSRPPVSDIHRTGIRL